MSLIPVNAGYTVEFCDGPGPYSRKTFDSMQEAERFANRANGSVLVTRTVHVNTVLSSAAKETLIALIETGPLWDGDVPSKVGRDELLDAGLAQRVVVRGEDGWQAATYAGRDAYKAMLGGSASLQQAKAYRLGGGKPA